MKYLFLFLLLLVSCRSSTQPEFEGEVVTRVWYEAEANLTWVEYQDVEYKGEEYAEIFDEAFLESFFINEHLDKKFSFTGNFIENIIPGMGLAFTNSNVMEVVYFEDTNVTYLKFSGPHYKNEKYAQISYQDFFDVFTVLQGISHNQITILGDFRHSIITGSYINFSN